MGLESLSGMKGDFLLYVLLSPAKAADRDSSGRKIIEILKKNPTKDPNQYDEEDLPHMRKVVGYNKRHLAQEAKAKQDTNSKSFKSLKNWGHDPLKT